MHTRSEFRNRLAGETSPYLLQHAANPVDWHPWGEEALERARREQKPILLSIGYAACHWCHVMAHECFEDEHIAKLMNELFVNIKVDREERPDLDKIYQLAHQVLTQRAGGWPLTMFLTHDDHRPFFGGTYFPPIPRHGLPGFPELLERVAQYYRERMDDVRRQNTALMEVFADLTPPPAGTAEFDHEALQAARRQLEQQFDGEYGGIGGAPKFPHARSLEFLLRHWRASSNDEQPDLQALYMCSLTLARMAEGGIYDQLGGGFCRYSVDRYWMIPHFEKMLYDNAELLHVYADAAVATGEPIFKRVAIETAAWMRRDMQAPEGGFWSTLDADSEGHEGLFYVWDREQIRDALTADEYAVTAARYGLDNEPNFEGRWHLHVYRSVDDVAAHVKQDLHEVEHLLAAACAKLLALRNRRIWPGRDEKVLTSWNGLAISTMACASRALGDSSLYDSARQAADFVRNQLWRDDRLLAVYKDGQARLPAYLDDHAFMLDALLEMLQTQWRDEDLEWAISLADLLLKHFQDRDKGGFYFTADDHEALIHRPKSFSDDALPSGNAIAARALIRLGYLLGETRYLDAAENTLRAAWPALQRYPSGHCAILTALDEFMDPPNLVIIRGEDTAAREWQQELAKVYAPRRWVFAIPSGAALPPALAAKTVAEETIAYVCRAYTCSEPVKSLSALIALTRD